MPELTRRADGDWRDAQGKETIENRKRRRIERKGPKAGSTNEFLGLAEDHAAYLEVKLAVSDGRKHQWERSKLTQVKAAKMLTQESPEWRKWRY